MFTRTLQLGLLLGVFACSQEPARAPDQTTTTSATQSDAPTPALTASPANDAVASLDVQPNPTPLQPSPTENIAGSSLDDAQIAAITDAANTGEIEQARIALRRAKDPRVRAFAQRMIDQHGDAKMKQEMLMSSMNLTDVTTPTSADISNAGQQALTTLNSARGNDFDKTYMELQVREHQKALDLFDTKLIPSAHSPDLKRELVDFRPLVADHLKRAQDLQQILSKE
jgi:putative membrane protein